MHRIFNGKSRNRRGVGVKASGEYADRRGDFAAGAPCGDHRRKRHNLKPQGVVQAVSCGRAYPSLRDRGAEKTGLFMAARRQCAAGAAKV